MRLGIFIFLLALLFSVNAENLLKNGGFEKIDHRRNFPVSWQKSQYKGGQGKVEVVSSNVASGKFSLQLQKSSTSGWLGCDQVIRFPNALKKAQTVTITFRACATDLKHGYLVLTAGDQKKAQKQWKVVQIFRGSFDWKSFSKKIILQPGITRMNVSIRLSQPGGILWLDNLEVKLTEATLPPGANLVKNSNLTGGNEVISGLPVGWKKKFYHGLEAVGECQVIPATPTRPATLQLKWERGARRFGAEALLKPIPQGAFCYRVSGAIKTQTHGQALFAVEMYDARGHLLGEQFSAPFTSSTWRQHAFKFSSLSGTCSLKLYCLTNDIGLVQFRQVNCVRLPGTVSPSLPLEAKLLPIEGNRVWNGNKNEFTSFIEAPLPLTFHFKGLKKSLNQPELILDLPQELKISDAFTMHFIHYQPEHPRQESIKRATGNYQRYHFRDLRVFDILQPNYGWSRKLSLAIEPAHKNIQPGKYRIFWQLADRTRRGAEQSFDFNLQHWPKPTQALPDFPIFRWDCYDTIFTQDPLINRLAKLYEQCNMNVCNRFYSNFPRGRAVNKLLTKRGWKHYRTWGNFNYISYFKPQELKLLRGKIEFCQTTSGLDKKRFCPNYFTDDPQFKAVFEAGVKQRLRDLNCAPGDMIMLDIEPWSPFTWCFCQRCREKFARQFKISPVPTAMAIKKNYREQWSRFRCENTTAQVAMYRKIFQKDFPHLKLADYDYIVDFRRPDYRKSYYAVAKDPEMIDPYIDMHISSYYHVIDRAAFEMIRVNSRQLSKSYIPICAIDHPGTYLTPAEILNPAQFRLMVLAAAVNGCPGFAIYPGLHLDGQYLLKLRRALEEITPLQKYFRQSRQDARNVISTPRPYKIQQIGSGPKQKNLRLPLWAPYFVSQALALKNECLIATFNYHPTNTMFVDQKLTLPPGKYTVLISPHAPQLIPSPTQKIFWDHQQLKNGLLLEVPPQDLIFTVVRPYSATDQHLPQTLSPAQVEKNFRQHQRFWNKSAENFKPVRANGLTIELADFDNNGAPELKISSPRQSFWLDYQHGGTIKRWQCGNQIGDFELNVDKLWAPKSARGEVNSKAIIKKTSIVGKRLQVILEKQSTNLPLTIQCSYQFTSDQKGIDLEYKITNKGSKSLNFCWWKANRFPVKKAQPLRFYHQFNHQKIWRNIPHGDLYFPIQGAQWSAIPVKRSQPLPDSVVSGVKIANVTLVGQPELRHLMSYYYWSSHRDQTWEWIYQPIKLQPQDSWHFKEKFTLEN